jgi:hypothetical protein
MYDRRVSFSSLILGFLCVSLSGRYSCLIRNPLGVTQSGLTLYGM